MTPNFIEFSDIEVKEHIHKYTVVTIAVSHEIASLRNVTLRHCALEPGPWRDSFAVFRLSAQCADRCDPMWWQMGNTVLLETQGSCGSVRRCRDVTVTHDTSVQVKVSHP